MVLQRYRAKQVATSLAFCMSTTRLGPARLPLAELKTACHNCVQELGKGSFGTVYLTEGRRDKKPYVVKVRRDWPTRGAGACGRERRARILGAALRPCVCVCVCAGCGQPAGK